MSDSSSANNFVMEKNLKEEQNKARRKASAPDGERLTEAEKLVKAREEVERDRLGKELGLSAFEMAIATGFGDERPEGQPGHYADPQVAPGEEKE